MHTTASELWDTWVEEALVRPQDYDKDLAGAIRRQLPLGAPADLSQAMDQANWKPRDLLHAIAGELESFSGMLQDLLRFYEKVGAKSATGDSLRISFEFDEDDALDLLLSSFREEVVAVGRTAKQVSVGVTFLPNHAWSNPARDLGSIKRAEDAFQTRDFDAWAFSRGVPRPSPTGDDGADAVIERGLAVVQSVLKVLSALGTSRAEATEWLRQHPEAEDSVEGLIARATHDFWPMTTAASLHELADAIRNGTVRDGLIEQVAWWLEGFNSDEAAESHLNDVTNLLSLPTWGKRHDLYSAWITAQLDEALAPDRAEFRVDGGVLRFPFRATHLADIAVAGGLHQLWSEVRTDFTDPLSGKRLRGIQPDYRLVRPSDNGDMATVLAVEVKQYLRSATSRHGKVLATYAAALPQAAVFIVAHGPLGRSVRDKVPSVDRSRTRVFEHVRPGRENETDTFRAEVSALLPAPQQVRRLELRWDPSVHDLDWHVRGASGDTISWREISTSDGQLQRDAYDGGPETLVLRPHASPHLDVRVHLYSDDALQIIDAKPEVIVQYADGTVERLHLLSPSGDPRWWQVCTINRYGVVLSSETSKH